MRVPNLPETLYSTFVTYLSRGQAFSQAGQDSAYLYEDFLNSPSGTSIPGWLNSLGGTGSISCNVANTKGGIARMSTGATAASNANVFTVNSAFSNSNTDKWYVAWRHRVPTAIDNQTRCQAGVFNAILAGVYGPGSVANFGFSYDNTESGALVFTSFGVAIDTNFHVYEFYCRGDSVLRARLDGGAEFTANPASPITSNGSVAVQCRNGTTAADRQIDVDWVVGVFGRM